MSEVPLQSRTTYDGPWGGGAVSYERGAHVASSLRDLMLGSQPRGTGSSASLGLANYDR